MSHAIARAGTLMLLLLAGSRAEAAIQCKEGFQMSGGREIATPYCGDNYLAEVARQHGFKVSNEEIRNNPASKDEVCRFISSDIRISDYCHTDSDGSDRGK